MKKYAVLFLFLLCLGGFLYYKNSENKGECRYIHQTYIGTVVRATDHSITIADRGTGREYESFYGEQTLYWEPDLKPGDEVSIESEYWEGSEQPFPAFKVHYYPYSPSPTPSQSFEQSLE